MSKWIKANRGDILFEDTSVGRLKKYIWDASDKEIDKILAENGDLADYIYPEELKPEEPKENLGLMRQIGLPK